MFLVFDLMFFFHYFFNRDKYRENKCEVFSFPCASSNPIRNQKIYILSNLSRPRSSCVSRNMSGVVPTSPSVYLSNSCTVINSSIVPPDGSLPPRPVKACYVAAVALACVLSVTH